MKSIARAALLRATLSPLRPLVVRTGYLSAAALATLSGCHADENDPAGQAEELSDPLRRANAIENIQRIYSGALADNNGDRSSEAVMAVADAVAPVMNQAFLDNPGDGQNRLAMLEVFKQMRDPRTVPALIDALNWRPGVNEDQAIRSAQAFTMIEVPDERRAEVVAGLSSALERAIQDQTDRGPRVRLINQLRIELLRALGNADHPSALPILVNIATTLSPSQNFLINRLAAQQLGEHAGAEQVAPMIRALYLFPESNPAMRMNDVATEVLVRIGEPAVAPLLATLRGENSEANELAESYIAAARERDANAAAQLSVPQVVGTEATVTLGKLGFPAALDPLIEETRSDDMFRRVNAAVALVSLIVPDADKPRVKETLVRVYASLDEDIPQAAGARAQLIVAMTKLYDPAVIPFLTAQARDGDTLPVARLEAIKGIAMLADKEEAEALQQAIAGMSDDPYHQQFTTDTQSPIAVAVECDENIACYIGKLGDSDVAVVRKAATMLGRLGAGNAEATAALVERLGHSDLQARFSVLYALDRIATSGSQEAIDKITELQDVEEGRGIWTRFSQDALPIQARLRARL